MVRSGRTPSIFLPRIARAAYRGPARLVPRANGARMYRLSLLAAAALAVACAGPPRGAARSCDASFDHVDAVLRAGLDDYVREIGRYAAARDPQATTADAVSRVQVRADAWSKTERRPFLEACREWPEERHRCVLAARDAPALNACGLEPLVRSFTDDVVADFAARPIALPPAAR
jgi:hypothetical protein